MIKFKEKSFGRRDDLNWIDRNIYNLDDDDIFTHSDAVRTIADIAERETDEGIHAHGGKDRLKKKGISFKEGVKNLLYGGLTGAALKGGAELYGKFVGKGKSSIADSLMKDSYKNLALKGMALGGIYSLLKNNRIHSISDTNIDDVNEFNRKAYFLARDRNLRKWDNYIHNRKIGGIDD